MNSYESHFRQDLLKIALHFTYFLMLKHKNWPISSPLLILFHLFSSLHIWMNGCEWVFCVFSFDTVCVVLLTTGMQEIQICTDTIKMEVWVIRMPCNWKPTAFITLHKTYENYSNLCAFNYLSIISKMRKTHTKKTQKLHLISILPALVYHYLETD